MQNSNKKYLQIISYIDDYLDKKDYFTNYFMNSKRKPLSHAFDHRVSWDTLLVTCKFLIENYFILNNITKKILNLKISQFIKKDEIFANKDYFKNDTMRDLQKAFTEIIRILEILEIVKFDRNNFEILNKEIMEFVISDNWNMPVFFLIKYTKKYLTFFDLNYNSIKKNIKNYYSNEKNNKLSYKSINKNFERDKLLDNLLKQEWTKKLNIEYSEKNSKRIINKIFNILLLDIYEGNNEIIMSSSIYLKDAISTENLDSFFCQYLKMIDFKSNSIENDIEQVYLRDDIKKTYKEILVNSRLGQGKYRSTLLEKYEYCILTGCCNKNLLIASHIKPWNVSTDEERLNWENGLLLHTSIDILFDKFYISFDKSGFFVFNELEISKNDLIKYTNIKKDILDRNTSIFDFIKENTKRFLEYHYHMFLTTNKK